MHGFRYNCLLFIPLFVSGLGKRSFFSFRSLHFFFLYFVNFFLSMLPLESTPFSKTLIFLTVRLNKLPKVYYVLLLSGILSPLFLCYCLHRVLPSRKFPSTKQSCFLIDFNGFLHAFFRVFILSPSFSSCSCDTLSFSIAIHH